MKGTMKARIAVLAGALILAAALCASVVQVQAHAEAPSAKKDATTPAVTHTYDADAMRVQGELRYRANCGRCHAAPRKFPPRTMATVLRHMRVRATITDEDMRLVLFYMSQ
jgi:cytochrome c5